MLRLATLLVATSALAPIMTASAIKVTLSGEIDLGLEYPNVTSYSPTPDVSADLDFDIVHAVGDGNELGGNINLDVAYTFGTSPTHDVSLSKADIYVSGGFGELTFTTDGELDNAESYLSVAEQVTGDDGDLSLVYTSPTFQGISGGVAFDVLGGDASASLGYQNDLLELDFDVKQVSGNFLIDGELEATFGKFTGNLHSALGTNSSQTELEGAIRAAYDFGTATVHVGASSYFELEAGVEFEVQGLTLSFDVSGMTDNVDPSTFVVLTPTSTVKDTLTIDVGAEYEYGEHLTIEAEIQSKTVVDDNNTTVSLGALLEF